METLYKLQFNFVNAVLVFAYVSCSVQPSVRFDRQLS